MQVLEVLADDSNFRSMAMELSAAPAAAMLTLPPGAFESAWCAGEATASVRLSRLSSASQFPTSTLHAPLYTPSAGIMGVVACQIVMAPAIRHKLLGSYSISFQIASCDWPCK